MSAHSGSLNTLKRPGSAPLRRLISGLVLATIAGGIWAIYAWHTPILSYLEETAARALDARVERIMVEGSDHVNTTALSQAINMRKGDPLVGLDVAAIRRRVEALDWVKWAVVRRDLPATLRVEVYEHRPLARVTTEDDTWLITAEGQPIVPADETFSSLPLLEGDGAKEAAAGLFTLLGSHPQLLGNLERARFMGQRRWDVTLRPGVTIRLPEADAEKALSVLMELEKTRGVLSATGALVDLRLKDRVILRPGENTLQ